MTIFGEWVVGSKDQLTGVSNGKTVKNLKKSLELTTCSIDEAQVSYLRGSGPPDC